MGKGKTFTQAAMVAGIAKETGVAKGHVSKVLEELKKVAVWAISSAGPGKFQLPGIVQIQMFRTKAKPARTIMMFGKQTRVKAKPAGVKAKARLLVKVREEAKKQSSRRR